MPDQIVIKKLHDVQNTSLHFLKASTAYNEMYVPPLGFYAQHLWLDQRVVSPGPSARALPLTGSPHVPAEAELACKQQTHGA